MSNALASAAAIAVAIASSSAHGAELTAKQKRELGYFLPKTRVAATVAQTIRACPTAVQQTPEVQTMIVIADQSGPDPKAFVRVDARSGFLARRTTKLGLRPDGTLQTFNASTEGEGGEVISALVKGAATVAAWSVGAPVAPGAASAAIRFPALPASPPLACKPDIEAALKRLGNAEGEIAALEAIIAAGGSTPAQEALLERRRREAEELVSKLTLTSAEPALFDPAREDGAVPRARLIPKIDYSRWFTDVRSPGARGQLDKITGSKGFIAELTPSKAFYDALSGDGSALSSEARSYLFYRRPVPASVAVAPCLSTPVDEADGRGRRCTPDERDVAGSASKKVLLPQMSGIYAIRIGRGGLFGTREAAAKFDENGAPLELQYGSSSGGADIAKVVDNGLTSAGILRDAELTALNRRIETVKALQELQDLLAQDQ